MNLNAILATASVLVFACGSSQTDSRAYDQGAVGDVGSTAVASVPRLSDTPARDDSATAPAADTVAPAQCGAEQWAAVLAAVDGARVGGVFNHTSRSGGQHLADRLLASDVALVMVFAPEHGFRGLASDGEKVADATDPATGLPIASLYGKSKRPTAAMLADLDVLLFDIQDVGLRFYTYLSTLHYVMDAAAEYGKRVVVLDRPNPNGRLVDGPVLDTAYRSFIGMHPIPVAHGMTLGELARMINGEGWLSKGREAQLEVVPVRDYAVGDVYELPLKPSPNLPTQNSIYRYPTLCFFEGTVASVGRGTDYPFEVVGHPSFEPQDFAFTPESRPGATYAPLKGEKCWGLDLRDELAPPQAIDWSLLRDVMSATKGRPFVSREKHFDLLAGGTLVREWLKSGEHVAALRAKYAEELRAFVRRREPYLLYAR